MTAWNLFHIVRGYEQDDVGDIHLNHYSHDFVCRIEAPTRRSAMAQARKIVKTRVLFSGRYPTHDLEEVDPPVPVEPPPLCPTLAYVAPPNIAAKIDPRYNSPKWARYLRQCSLPEGHDNDHLFETKV